jgi:hypothetical protein
MLDKYRFGYTKLPALVTIKKKVSLDFFFSLFFTILLKCILKVLCYVRAVVVIPTVTIT